MLDRLPKSLSIIRLRKWIEQKSFQNLLFIGSRLVSNRKGFEDFMENCAKHLDNEWSFNVVGRCDDSIKKNI